MKRRPETPSPGCAFQGYPGAALPFLTGLAAHNEKGWFEANRAVYEAAVKAPTAALIGAVSDALQEAGLPLEGSARRSAFRIHRDVRFSKDKSPYKTNAGTFWYRQGGGKAGSGILYFHLAPAGCFVACAFYMPDADVLGSIRERIRVHPDMFMRVTAELAGRALVLDPADSLSRMPKGFEDMGNTPVAAPLRLKSFIVRRAVGLAVVHSAGLVGAITAMAADALPLLRFGWAAIDEAG